MQNTAFDENKFLVSAHQADKQKNYFCPECLSVVRLKAGFQRRLHFFHLQSTHTCRLSRKSLEHLYTQLYLKKHLHLASHCLEHFFPTIKRIADVYWPLQKIVFEIQCSSISAEEIMSRVRDYTKIGCKIVWILHDKRFNTHKLSPEEESLFFHPHYFTNINHQGLGWIYDQYRLLKGTSIIKKSPLASVDFTSPMKIQRHALKELKTQFPPLFSRAKKWAFSFKGDLIDRASSKDKNVLEWWKKHSISLNIKKISLEKKAFYFLTHFYHKWLEKFTI